MMWIIAIVSLQYIIGLKDDASVSHFINHLADPQNNVIYSLPLLIFSLIYIKGHF